MAYFNEDNVTEQMCIEVAKQSGYKYVEIMNYEAHIDTDISMAADEREER